MTPQLLYLIGGLCFVVGSAMQMGQQDDVVDDDEAEEAEPWGFQVKDGGVVDGGETDWEGWQEKETKP